MEIFLIKAAQLIAALAFLVIIHEFGHYIVARIFSIKVEKFYLFFNPWFSLAKWKPKKGKPRYDKNGNERASWRDTVYGIGWLPLGGYVKIAGMIDESMDTEQMKQPAKPWEFRSKPAWQRLCVMLAGVIFNFILAILIYAGIAFYWGNKYVPLNKAYEGMDYSKVALAAGFQNGDIPYAADNHVLDISADNVAMLVADAKEVTVLRKSVSDSVLMAGVKEVARDTVTFRLPDHFLTLLEKDDMFMTFRMPVFVKKVVGGSPASEAGLLVDDRLVAVGGVPTPAYAELQEQLARHKSTPTTLTVQRGDSVVTLNVTPDSDGRLGFNLKEPKEVYPVVFEKYSFFGSFPKGWEIGTTTLTGYVKAMRHVFSSSGVKSIGGFGSLGDMFPERWNWLSFWEIAAFLSVVLAFMNLLPIPGLDGGHVMFLLWEVITGRKVNDKVMEYAQIAGMLFLVLLLLYANGADVVRAFMK